MIRFIEANASRAVAGGVDDLEFVVPQFDHGISQQADVCMKGLGMTVKILFHDHKLVLDLYLVCGKAVGCQDGFLEEIRAGPNVIKVLMGQDDEVDVSGFQSCFCKGCLQDREIGSHPGVNEDVFHSTLDEIHMASRPLGTDLVDVGA